MQRQSILIVDSDDADRNILAKILLDEGFTVDPAIDCTDALNKIKSNSHHLVIADVALPDRSGLLLLSEIKSNFPYIPVLILSKTSTVEIAVEAIKQGAVDFISKPISRDVLIQSTQNAISNSSEKSNKSDKKIIDENQIYPKEIVTSNEKMVRLLKTAKNIAHSTAPVLIQGESGTGKELLAAFIVKNSGRERNPYIAMNCAALPDALAESELFGHEKGAFTGAFKKRIGKFEQAHRGTLLLDEISELNLPLQAKLLRVLQEGKIDRLGGEKSVSLDTRIISTCNIDLKQSVKDGKFRKDLFYRINVIPILIPPLRERKDDIPILIDYFIKNYSYKNNKQLLSVSAQALDYLCSYEWPGNIRELENVIERAVLISGASVILPEHLLIDNDAEQGSNEFDALIGTTVKDMEKKLIFNTLRHVNDNRTHAAKMLGISIRTLRNKLNEYCLEKK